MSVLPQKPTLLEEITPFERLRVKGSGYVPWKLDAKLRSPYTLSISSKRDSHWHCFGSKRMIKSV